MKVYILENVRTNNFSEEMGKEIGEAWRKVMDMVKDIPVTLYGIYHEYESNYEGDYTLSIATESLETLSSIDIPEAKYQRFSVDSIKENGVFETWQHIWQLEQQGKLARSYTFDYEQYNIDGSIEILIAIK